MSAYLSLRTALADRPTWVGEPGADDCDVDRDGWPEVDAGGLPRGCKEKQNMGRKIEWGDRGGGESE